MTTPQSEVDAAIKDLMNELIYPWSLTRNRRNIETLIASHAAQRQEIAELTSLLTRSRKGLLVLKTVLNKERLMGGRDVTEGLLDEIDATLARAALEKMK